MYVHVQCNVQCGDEMLLSYGFDFGKGGSSEQEAANESVGSSSAAAGSCDPLPGPGAPRASEKPRREGGGAKVTIKLTRTMIERILTEQPHVRLLPACTALLPRRQPLLCGHAGVVAPARAALRLRAGGEEGGGGW